MNTINQRNHKKTWLPDVKVGDKGLSVFSKSPPLGMMAVDPDGMNSLWSKKPNRVAATVILLSGITVKMELESALKDSREKVGRVVDETVEALAFAVETRDLYTADHQRRVAFLACAIAAEMGGIGDDQMKGIQTAATIHDIGKLKIPFGILNKPSPLDDLEFALIKKHPQAGFDILKGIEFPWPIARIVQQHHEHFDGSGYPAGLKGNSILLEARIIGVADAVEAMASHRPYRPGKGIAAALQEINQARETLYDPEVVDACLALFRKGFVLPNGERKDHGAVAPETSQSKEN